jgi:hypothetical protein
MYLIECNYDKSFPKERAVPTCWKIVNFKSHFSAGADEETLVNADSKNPLNEFHQSPFLMPAWSGVIG